MRSSRDVRCAADQAHARYSAARKELLAAVDDLAATEAWKGDGARDLSAWIASRWQITRENARDLVREAEALRERPALAEALGSGSISIDQCKALETLCRPGTDDDEVWLETLWSWPLRDLQREARKVKAREAARRDDGVYLRMRHTADERYLRGEFQLHPEDGATLLAAIEGRIPDGTPLRGWDHASARALVELAKDTTVRSPASDRATVLLSVDQTSLSQTAPGDAIAELSSGGYVGIPTARRLACDGRVQVLEKSAEGRITGFGRTSRTVPPPMRRAVLQRDGGVCTFPGCEHDRHLACHHIRHWSLGGPTEMSNLVTVCWTHHELIHEGGWSLRREAGPRIVWIRPDGTPFEPRVRVVLDTC